MVEHATAMPEMSFPKKPRSGQWSVIREAQHRAMLNAKLPTGYGKTLAACYVFALKKQLGIANRLLIVFPTDPQIEQFIKDGHRDLVDAGIDGPHKIVDVRHAGSRAFRDHRSNLAQVFVITIQSLIETRGYRNVVDLLGVGQWMIVIDEYHHYGMTKQWGRTVLSLNRAFLLAMSATPTRPQDDSAFGMPHVSVKYRDAWEEGTVKRLKGHAYHFRIEAISTETSETLSFTTDEIIAAAGSERPDDIERFRIERKMRWSPKYVSPLVQIPIDRMIAQRLRTGQRLQVLVSAMCVSHAELICEQITEMYPELRCDWVGTGPFGRSQQENTDVLKEFCPEKDEDGNRHPTLDVLVHVGMAGEGLDAIHVSEVVLLCKATLCNRILQIIGRGARWLLGVECNVSFDSSSEFRDYVGETLMDAMDLLPPDKETVDTEDKHDEFPFPPDLPNEPEIIISNIELLHINSGTEGVKNMARVIDQIAPGRIDLAALMADPKHADWSVVIDLYRQMRKIEAESHDERATIEQWKDRVGDALTTVTTLVVAMLAKSGVQISDRKTIRGEIKTKINTRKKAMCGALQNDLELIKRHYGWLLALSRDLRERKSVPPWLWS
jgi:superfamily II DNA or RNA helicase